MPVFRSTVGIPAYEGMTVERAAGNDCLRPYAIIRPMFPPLRRIFLPRAGQSRRALNFLAVHSGLIVCALFLLAGLVLAGDYGIGIDDGNQRQIAQDNLDYIRGQPYRVTSVNYHDRAYGVAFELPLLLAERALGLTDYYYIHRLRLTLTHLFFIVGAYFCYRLAYQLFGSRRIALFALLIFLLHPRLYPHSYINSKDLPFLTMFVIALYLLERAFRRDTIGAFVLLGIGVGLLTNLRIMGLMLFPAVIAMRGWDGFYAGRGPERKRILGTAGLFALAAGLTWYAVTPYAWTNPGDSLATNFALAVNQPAIRPLLFQGNWVLSDQLPAHYNALWFSITTPPLFLLLVLMGIAAVAAGGVARPGAVFGNTRLRCHGLLLACFLLPPLAAVLLGSNQYDNWRHLYFSYAPGVLLAAGGLYWLAAARVPPGRWRAGLGGLAGLGLGLTALQMAQIHPLQYSYFNFLVDRTTPEYLRTQYEMDSWKLARREGLEYLAERYPGETLVVRAERPPHNILPPLARQGLILATGGRRADWELLYKPNPGQGDLAFNAPYRRRLYNNTLVAVRPLDAARMTPAAVAAYREIYRQALAGEPIIRADYKVYLEGQRLTFVQENCPPEGRDVWFGARLFPHRPETLPPHLWQPGSYATFSNNRVRVDDTCLAVIQLPDYAQGDLILAQRPLGNWGPAAGLPLWAELYSISQPGLGELIAEHRRQSPAAANPAAFAVFIDREAGRHRLLYAKENCTPTEYETPITLHITPVDLTDLPAYNRGGSFDNRDFPIDYYGGRPGGDCVAIVPLPDYPIAAIRTGQADQWEVNLYPLTEPDTLRATYAALSDSQPAIRAVFALYLQDNQLIYLRETCAAADTAANFFLHIIPADIADLPQERQAAGFANQDFAFDRWGGHFDGKCLATVPLPDYPIKEIRTGQHIPGQGQLWAAEVVVGR